MISFLKRSKERVAIFMAFTEVRTPTELAKMTSLAPSHISRTLKEFCAKGLVECLSPDHKMGRLYKLSKRGGDIQAILLGGEIADKTS